MYIPHTPMIGIISKPYHDHRMKPFYIKFYNILNKIFLSNIKPIVVISIISAWNTDHIEVNIDCYTVKGVLGVPDDKGVATFRV